MITGGSSGIGLAIAERFLQEGASKVIIVGRSYPRLLDAANRLQNATGNVSIAEEDAGDEVATRAPEEDKAVGFEDKLNESNGSQGELVSVSEKISLLVGDVSAIDSWTRTLEKEMVRLIMVLMSFVH